MSWGKTTVTKNMPVEDFVRSYSYLLSGGYAVQEMDWRRDDPTIAPGPDDIEAVEAVYDWSGDYAEESVMALLRLNDGRYAVVDAGCDTTGYDCQGSVYWGYFTSFENAVNLGLTEEIRNILYPKENDDQ
jgi:hypothetical protein